MRVLTVFSSGYRVPTRSLNRNLIPTCVRNPRCQKNKSYQIQLLKKTREQLIFQHAYKEGAVEGERGDKQRSLPGLRFSFSVALLLQTPKRFPMVIFSLALIMVGWGEERESPSSFSSLVASQPLTTHTPLSSQRSLSRPLKGGSVYAAGHMPSLRSLAGRGRETASGGVIDPPLLLFQPNIVGRQPKDWRGSCKRVPSPLSPPPRFPRPFSLTHPQRGRQTAFQTHSQNKGAPSVWFLIRHLSLSQTPPPLYRFALQTVQG